MLLQIQDGVHSMTLKEGMQKMAAEGVLHAYMLVSNSANSTFFVFIYYLFVKCIKQVYTMVLFFFIIFFRISLRKR